MPLLSAVVITKNEERNIRECLSTLDWVDEIIVVDGGSTDRTVSLAKKSTKKVYVRPWKGYGSAKNYAQSKAKGEWILWLDADERVTSDLREEIEGTLKSSTAEVSGFDMPRKAFFLGKWIKHCGWYPGRVTRLFRRSSGKFTEDRVHERLLIQGKTLSLREDLLHYTDPNLFHYFDKFNRYTSFAAEDLQNQGRRFSYATLLLNPFWVFVKMYILKRGFLDGIQGFILCVLSSCYVFTKYAKLWEISVHKEIA
ncbi:MAG: glycosyltransferase family 2 protein [Bacteroidota bacterium]